MRQQGKLRTEQVHLHYSPEEYQRMKKHFARSTKKTISSYVRSVSLQEPVVTICRNASFDAFVEEVILLRKEMADVRQLPMTPEREEQLIRLHEDIKSVIYKIADLCMPS